MNIIFLENHVLSAYTQRRKLIESLTAMGHKIRVLSTGTPDEMAFAQSLGFDVVEVGTSNTNPTHVYAYMRMLGKTIKDFNTDVCFTFTMRPAIWGNLVCRRIKVPVITNITGIGPLAHSTSPAYRVARTLYRTALLKTKTVFFQNADDLQIFKERRFIRPGQAEIIPGSGVDVEFFAPQPALPNEKFTFLFISRLIKDKGIIEYVEAARQMKAWFPDVVCQVIGPFYEQNLKENIVTRGQMESWQAEGIVQYLGASKDVRPHIAAADCIVLPSYREGMSNVLLEAASMQKPAITCNVTGCKDIVVHGETGLLCAVRDAADLAAKMKEMYGLSATARARMGQRARERVTEKFAKQIVVDAYVKQLEALNDRK